MHKYVHVYYFATMVLFLFLKGLVEVITNSDDHISVRATILLGELLHMVSFYILIVCLISLNLILTFNINNLSAINLNRS